MSDSRLYLNKVSGKTEEHSESFASVFPEILIPVTEEPKKTTAVKAEPADNKDSSKEGND